LGGYVQAYTLYSSVRPFGVTAIVGGWDSEADLGAKAGGPGLYMIEPSGLYWVLELARPLALKLCADQI
jgi:20S proteasome subunit alpha 7